MKKIRIILIVLMTTLFNVKVVNSQVQNTQVIEQALVHADTTTSEDSNKPITKTVIIEEEEKNVPSPNDKWITAALAALGVVLVIVFRMLRKKKKIEKTE